MPNNLGISVSSAGGLPIGVSNTNLHGITSAAAAVGLSHVQAAVAASSTGQAPSWAAAATKSTSLAPSLINNAFDSYNGILSGSNSSAAAAAVIGSWATSVSQSNKPAPLVGSKWFSSSDDTGMSNGLVKLRNDAGNFDDGTAIWGSPSTKKSGVDWDNSSGQPVTTKVSTLTNNHDLVNNLAENIKDAENRSSHGFKQIPSFNGDNGTEGKISQEQKQNSISNVKVMQSNHLVTNDAIDNGTGAWGSLSIIEKVPSSTIENSHLDSNLSPSVNNTNSRWDGDNTNQSLSSRPVVPISQNSLWDTSSKKVAQAKAPLGWCIESGSVQNSSFYFADNTNAAFGDSISDQNSLNLMNNIGKSNIRNINYANKQFSALADIGYKDIDIRTALTNAGIFHQPLTQATLQLFNELSQQDSLLRDLQSQASQQMNKSGNSPTIAMVNKVRQNMQAVVDQLVTQHVMYTKQTSSQNNKPFISGLNLGIQGVSNHRGNSSQILTGISSSCDPGTNTLSDSQINAKALDGFSSGLSGLSSLPRNSLNIGPVNPSASNMSAGSRMNATQIPNNPGSSWAAAATKSPPSSNGTYEYSGNIGSWSSVNNQSSGKPGSKWDSNDSGRRNENGFDDGTAIWENPSANKSGIDWAEANPIDSTKNNRATSTKNSDKASPSVQNGSNSNGVSGWGQPFNASTKPATSNAPGWNNQNIPINNRMASPPDPIWPSSDKSQVKDTDWPIGDTQSGIGSGGFGFLDDSSLNIRKPSTKSIIQGTKQFQILTKMGFEGEEIENALRSRNMNLESAIDDLRNGIDRANKKNDNDSLVSNSGKASVIGNSYQSSSLIVSPSTSPDKSASNQQSLSRQPLISQNQQNFDQNGQISNAALTGQASNQPIRISGLSSNVPSTAQLKHMVQQIQLAVQAGHLNAQILNQPLAPVTLQLLYQLLQQIKALHQLQIHATQQFGKTGSHPPASINVQITKTKQTILNLQNQIAAQQALFLKQNQQHTMQQGQSATSSGSGNINIGLSNSLANNGQSLSTVSESFKATSMNDSQSQSPNDTLDGFGMNGDLNQNDSWRSSRVPYNLGRSSGNSDKSLSSFMSGDLNEEFARAPGHSGLSSSKGEFAMPRSSAWSNFASDSELVWPNTSGISPTKASQQQSNAAFDLVPEFEPGKPWRGSILMKSLEDDPTMTPGSLARSLASHQQKDEVDDTSSLFSCWPTNSNSATKTSPTAAITTSMSASNISEQFTGLSLQSNPWKYSSASPSSIGGNQTTSNTSNNIDNDSAIDGINTDMITRQNNQTSDAINNAANIKRNSLSSITLSTSASNDSSLSKLVHDNNNRQQQAAYSWVNLTAPSSNTMEQKRGGIDSLLAKLPGRPAPPPGLPTTIGSVYNHSDNSNSDSDNGTSGWGSSAAVNGWGDSIPKQQISGGSQWLLLLNLTLQSDGSTIKSLCSQHGPMQLFHLYLNHGFALVRYSSREEAAKARSSLNNCIINGTNIIADTPSDQEVQHYLQLGTSGQQKNW